MTHGAEQRRWGYYGIDTTIVRAKVVPLLTSLLDLLITWCQASVLRVLILNRLYVNTQHHLFTTIVRDYLRHYWILPHSTMVTIGFRLSSSLANDACHL